MGVLAAEYEWRMMSEIDWWLNCALETLVLGSKLEVERGQFQKFQVPIFPIRSGPLQPSTQQVPIKCQQSTLKKYG